MKASLLLIFLIFALLTPAKATLNVPEFKSAPRIDGRDDDNVWDQGLIISEFYQTSPGDNTAPSSPTEFLMGYDRENLYFLIRCSSDKAETIRDFHCSRDKIYSTDRVFIFLDTFNSRQKAYYVGCNPNGEQADGIVQSNIDPSIDLFFKSAGRRTEYGYILELALPLKSIKYRSGTDISWGFMVKRHIPAYREEITSSPVRRGGGNYFDNYGQIRFSNLPSNLNLKAIPALISDHTAYRDEVSDSKDEESRLEPELNLFFEPNSMITTTFTYNPDFNIIEADALNVDVNSRYEIYYPEKRPFFIEGSNPYGTPVDVFYTRKIVDPKYGAKLSGTFGNLSAYALTALDEDVPGSYFNDNFSGNKNTPFAFGALAWKTDRNDDMLRIAGALRRYGNFENSVLNFDNNFRLSRELEFSSQLAYSSNEVTDVSSRQIESGYAYSGQLNYYDGTWFIHNFAKGLSSNFTADLGYIPETDLNFLENRIEYQKHALSDLDQLRYLEIASTQKIKYDFEFRDIKHFYWEGMGGMVFRNKFEFWTGLEYMMENYLADDFYLYYSWLCLEYNTYGKLGAKIVSVLGRNMWYGDERGETGKYRKLETSLYVRPLNTVDIEFQQKYHETVDYYVARTYEVIAKFQFRNNFWLRLIMQVTDNDLMVVNEEHMRLDVYPLFTYKPSANAALYLGASKNRNESFYSGLKEIDDNTMTYFLKMSYTIDIL